MACGQSEAELKRHAKYALHDAAERNDVSLIAALTSEEDDEDYNPDRPHSTSLDINERDNTGCTPLQVALLAAAADAVGACLAKGAKINLKCNGSPPTHILLSMYSIPSNREVVLRMLDTLLAANVDMTANDDYGRSAFHLAGLYDAVPCAEKIQAKQLQLQLEGIIAPGPLPLDAAAVDKTGRTALHAAVLGRSAAMVAFLLKLGADVATAEWQYGETALHLAGKLSWQAGYEQLHAACSEEVKAMRSFCGKTAAELLAEAAGSAAAVEGGAVAGAARDKRKEKKTLILSHAICADHHTCAPINRQLSYVPPENTLRLDTLLAARHGTLMQEGLLSRCQLLFGAPRANISDVLRVHDYGYVRDILTAVGALQGQQAVAGAAVAGGAAAGAGENKKEAAVPFNKLLDSDTAVSK